MKVAFFDTHDFEKEFFEKANKVHGHKITYFNTRLTPQTALLAKDFECACCFVNDLLNEETLCKINCNSFKLIALRSAGYNNVNLNVARQLGLTVTRVPAYSPHAVAEHTVGLILALNRKIHKAYMRVRELNFSLNGLVGFDLYNKNIGVIGTGRIGAVFSRIMKGFGCNVLANDIIPNQNLVHEGIVKYAELEDLYRMSDIISLHLPLNHDTHYLINDRALETMRSGALLINTSRGALINSKALVESLKTGHIGGAALDVYEEEENVFFKDISDQVLQDDVLARLMTFPNVLITSHQGFLTKEALTNIAETTLQNISDFENRIPLKNQILPTV